MRNMVDIDTDFVTKMWLRADLSDSAKAQQYHDEQNRYIKILTDNPTLYLQAQN